MRMKMNCLLSCVITAVAVSVIAAGCRIVTDADLSDAAGGTKDTSAPQQTEETYDSSGIKDTTKETDKEKESEETKETGRKGIDFVIDDMDDAVSYKKRGIYLMINQGADMPYSLVISSGEKNTGGYGIKITDVKIDDNNHMVVTVEETSPAEDAVVIQALTYPSVKIRMSAIPESIDVYNHEGKKFSYVELEKKKNEDRYIAILRDGTGEITWETYVYKDKTGYVYVNTTSTTESWGSTKWKTVIDSTGRAASREEIVEIAKEHGSGKFCTFPGDNDPHPIEDFLKAD